MSASSISDPFSVADAEGEFSLARLEDERRALPLETYLSRALLALAVVLILWVDVRLAVDTPNYGPGVEAYQVAFAEQIAQHGTPPVLGKDGFVIDPTGPPAPRTVVLRRLEPPAAGPPTLAKNIRYDQLLAFERPYAYYLAAPVSWIVPWYHRLVALRLLCVALLCVSVGFLWATVREAWPANPLAAGVAAIVFGTMSGVVSSFAAFQPDALLVALWCAGMWLVLRDSRQRRCSWWTVAVWTVATGVSSVAVPASVAAILYLAIRAWRTRARGRILVLLAVVLAPTIAWVAWNLRTYSDPWPLNAIADGRYRPRDWAALTQVLTPIYRVNTNLLDGFYNGGLGALTRLDERPAGFVGAAVATALVMALLTGRIAVARLALARVTVLLVASFLSIYLTLFLSMIVAGADVDYGVPRFAGYAAAWAAVAGVAFTAPLGGRRWLAPVAVGALTLALVLLFLRTPVA